MERRMRRGYAVLIVVLAMSLVMTACGSKAYTKDGKVTLTDTSEQTHKVRIAEVQEKKDKTIVYIRGTSDFAVCNYEMGKHGFEWFMYIGLDMMDEEGNRTEPVEATPYMTGKSSGNTIGFTFEGTGYTGLYLYLADQKDGGVEVPLEGLEIPADLKMSDAVKKLEKSQN